MQSGIKRLSCEFYEAPTDILRNAAWLTIIGNIYDNSELLKGGDKDG